MIIFRYLSREIITTLAALTTILLLIFLSNQFVSYLGRAAGGQMPGLVVLKLMAMEIPTLLGLLLPLGMYMAILIAYGRFYAESEMTVLESCGFSQKKLLAMTMVIAVVTMVIVSILVLWLSPKVHRDRDFLLTGVGASAFLETLVPGRFRVIPDGKVVYIQNMTSGANSAANSAKTISENVFIAQRAEHVAGEPRGWDVLLAKRAYLEAEQLVLDQGARYEGVPGTDNFQIVQFDHYRSLLPPPTPRVRYIENVMPTLELFPINNSDRTKAAELQWRLSMPLMTLILAFLAVPMSRVNPRQGKYAKILPAIVVYMIYANLLFVARGWVYNGRISVTIGMWWLHGLLFLFALLLYAKPYLRAKLKALRT